MQVTGLQGSPLSMQQARLWSWQRHNEVYRTLCSVQIQGILEREVFKTGLKHVVERHEILHTLFYFLPGMDVPVQIVANDTLWSCPEISLAYLDTPDQYRKIAELFASLQKDVYDLQHGPLFHIWLFHLAEDIHVLLISLPTLCADNWSLKLFVDELRKAYMVSFRQETLAEEVLQYADVSAWQEEMILGDEAELLRQYWQKRDLSQVTTMRLPFEADACHSEKKVNEAFAPHMVEIPIEDALAQRIETQALRCGASISAWLLACWQVLLWRLSDEATFLVGVACDGRTHEDLANALGLYTRFVPIRAHFEYDRPFEFVLAAVNTSLQEAIKRQLYFTWDGVDASGGSDALFFPVSFEYETWPTSFDAGAVTFSLLKSSSASEPFVLKLSALRVGERLLLDLHYDPQRVPTEQVSRLAEMFRTLLTSTVEHPQVSVSVLSLLTADEQNRLLTTFSAPTRLLPAQGLHRLFEAQVKRTPNQLAVLSDGEQLTYQQLNERANQLAQVLRRRDVGPNALVGLCLARSAQMLVGLLGILKAGGAYVPLDVGSPPARLTYQLQECQARLLLTQREVSTYLPVWEGMTLCLEDLEQEMSEAPAADLLGGSTAEDLAYVIYTSGSTGTPKGVMIQQGSVVNYTLALCELLGTEPGWQYATVSTLAADLGNTVIFCALVSGGCVQVLNYETVTSVEAMTQWTELHPIDVLKIVPSHLSALLTGEWAVRLLPRRTLVLGGEALPTALLKQLQELGGTYRGRCKVFNHYGPTETTIGVLVHPLDMLEAEKGESGVHVPVGRPITNTQVYILDQRMQVVPVGMTGELYIGGSGLAMGYVQQAEQTAERFVPNPFVGTGLAPVRAGSRLYRTGDLARYGESGQIEFAGRRDSQVKLRGYRIELGEIEACLRQHPQIRTSVVVLREDVLGEPRLVSYIVARRHMPLTAEQLREFLLRSLPEYMVPAVYVQVDALPLSSNGKVDRQKLPVPELRPEREQVVAGKPRSSIEEMLLEIWRDLLGISMLGIHDDFFAVGGHSLLATRVMARVQAVLQIALPVQMLFEVPTVAGLAQRIEQVLQKSQGMEMPPLVAVARPETIPLSFAQQRLWFLNQLEPESTAYLAARARRFLGNLNTKALSQCVQELVRRHESLRTTFETRAGQPVQVIHPAVRVVLPVIDLQELRPERREQEARWLVKQEAQRPCDLEKGKLLRTHLVRLEMQEHVLLLTMHHIITDGWSNEVLVQELTVLYEAFVAGKSSPLAPLAIQYADYTLWQRQWLQAGEVLSTQLAYWRKQLADVLPLVLPTDASRLSIQTYQGAIQTLQLSQTLSERLVALSRQENVTLFMLSLAAFQILLLRYTSQTDISVGIPIANRTRTELEGVVGFFVNTLVMRTDLSGSPTFLEVLKRVREVALGAYAHQDIPFEYLVEKLQPERNLSRSPLCQVTFQLAYSLAASQQFPELKIESLAPDGALAHFDLGIRMIETQQGFFCMAIYNTNLFKEQTIYRMLEHWQTLLEGIVQNPQAHLSDLPLLTEVECHQLLVEWNATKTDSTPDLCLHQLFEQQVRQTPDTVAVVCEENALTYDELNQHANQLAHLLRRSGIGPDSLVGLCVERSLEMIIGLLAILKAGGAYVPLDWSYPKQRLAFMLQDTQVTVLLTQAELVEHLPIAFPLDSLGFGRYTFPVGGGWESMSFLDPLEGTATIKDVSLICLDVDMGTIAQQSETNLMHSVSLDNLAYVMYTSGSSGVPKGISVTHRAVVRLVKETSFASLHSEDVFLQLAPVSFDASTFEIWGALLNGARLVLFSGSRPSLEALGRVIQQYQISLLWLTAGLFHQMVEHQLQALTTIPQILAGGDALSLPHVQTVLDACPGSTLINGYGPTENTTFTCCHPMTLHNRPDLTVPIGTPIANTTVYLLDAHLQPVPVGVPGELYTGGDGLARGYLHRPDLTAERFIPHPFAGTGLAPVRAGARLYRTGDLARYRADGAIEYLGRIDSQVKIRGFRIELGEIEAVLEQHPAVREGVVTVRADRPDDVRLVAYVVLDLLGASETSRNVQAHLAAEQLKHWQHLYDETYGQKTPQTDPTFNLVGWNSSYTGQPIVEEEMQAWPSDTLDLVRAYHLVPLVRKSLQEQLPDYMVPTSFVVLSALPLTHNGKVDRRALPAPDEAEGGEHKALGEPRTPIEELVVGIWREVLGRSEVGIHDNFFELGGHSLLATQLVARVRATLSVEIPVRVIFETPTVAGLARQVEQELRKSEGIEALPVGQAHRLRTMPHPEAIPLSFAQQRLWFLDQLYPASTTYLNPEVLRFRGVLNVKALERSLQEVVHRHESLRTTFVTRDGQPLQVIHPFSHYVLPLIDLQGLEQEARTEAARALALQETQHTCNLMTGPLLRTYMLRLEVQVHVLLLTLHHIITDGWSNQVLVQELTTLYQAFAAGQPSPLAPLLIQYADYVLWQRNFLQGEVLQRYLAYWQRQLKGASPLELPTDAPRSAIQDDRGARYSFLLPMDLSTNLASLSRQEGVTLFVTLLAAFQVLLYRLTGQTDIVVGTDIANRTHVETEALLGFFVNLLALRARLGPGQLFRDVLQQVREYMLGAYTYQDLPFVFLIEQLLVERKQDQTPLVQVLFVLQNTPESVVKLPGIELEVLNREHTVARFDLALFLQEEPEGIRGSVVYRADLFAESTIATWMRQFEMVLGHIVVRPDTVIDRFTIDSGKAKRKQTREHYLKAKSVRTVKARELEIE